MLADGGLGGVRLFCTGESFRRSYSGLYGWECGKYYRLKFDGLQNNVYFCGRYGYSKICQELDAPCLNDSWYGYISGLCQCTIPCRCRRGDVPSLRQDAAGIHVHDTLRDILQGRFQKTSAHWMALLDRTLPDYPCRYTGRHSSRVPPVGRCSHHDGSPANLRGSSRGRRSWVETWRR